MQRRGCLEAHEREHGKGIDHIKGEAKPLGSATCAQEDFSTRRACTDDDDVALLSDAAACFRAVSRSRRALAVSSRISSSIQRLAIVGHAIGGMVRELFRLQKGPSTLEPEHLSVPAICASRTRRYGPAALTAP